MDVTRTARNRRDSREQQHGGLRRGLSRWANGEREDARELEKQSRKAGMICIHDAPDRDLVKLQGAISSVTLQPRGGVPALQAELYDGTGSIVLVWLGRRRIAGIGPGRELRVQGRIGAHEGERIMFNPRYELRPTHSQG